MIDLSSQDKFLTMRPQELFKPRHLLMPVDTAAEILSLSVDELTRQIEATSNGRFVLLDLPEGRYVEFKEGQQDEETTL